MTDLTLADPDPTTEAEFEAAFKQMLQEMDRLNQQMEQDRKDIERLKCEADLLKIETRAILATLGVAV